MLGLPSSGTRFAPGPLARDHGGISSWCSPLYAVPAGSDHSSRMFAYSSIEDMGIIGIWHRHGRPARQLLRDAAHGTIFYFSFFFHSLTKSGDFLQ